MEVAGEERERERDRGRKWSHVEASGRVESTLRENLGVRPRHIGFSGESWSMFPGSWLTRGIGYKATRPPDWFILSATPAHAALSRNYSVRLPLSPVARLSFYPPLLRFSLSRFYLSRCFHLSIPFSLSLAIDNPFFPHRVLTRVSCPTRAYRLAFDLRRKEKKNKIK